MKILLSISLAILTFLNVMAQDKIYTKDKQVLTVKIIEQTNKDIKYKMLDYPDGPILSLGTRSIEKIEYQNGHIDMLGNLNPRNNRPLGATLGIAYFLTHEGGYFIASLDYFILPQVDLQINIGSEFANSTYYSLGSRFHMNSNYSKKKLTPFSGILIGAENGAGFIQIPLGISYIGANGFDASLSLNELLLLNYRWPSAFLELKIGWRFKM
ncbi:MAG: hypothetical protein OEY51_09455 [Cyclobacteriaceae bacterium]|nr:hypothetical protein [Cyclobacteriaceae bacterium]